MRHGRIILELDNGDYNNNKPMWKEINEVVTLFVRDINISYKQMGSSQ